MGRTFQRQHLLAKVHLEHQPSTWLESELAVNRLQHQVEVAAKPTMHRGAPHRHIYQCKKCFECFFLSFLN